MKVFVMASVPSRGYYWLGGEADTSFKEVNIYEEEGFLDCAKYVDTISPSLILMALPKRNNGEMQIALLVSDLPFQDRQPTSLYLISSMQDERRIRALAIAFLSPSDNMPHPIEVKSLNMRSRSYSHNPQVAKQLNSCIEIVLNFYPSINKPRSEWSQDYFKVKNIIETLTRIEDEFGKVTRDVLQCSKSFSDSDAKIIAPKRDNIEYLIEWLKRTPLTLTGSVKKNCPIVVITGNKRPSEILEDGAKIVVTDLVDEADLEKLDYKNAEKIESRPSEKIAERPVMWETRLREVLDAMPNTLSSKKLAIMEVIRMCLRGLFQKSDQSRRAK